MHVCIFCFVACLFPQKEPETIPKRKVSDTPEAKKTEVHAVIK